MESYNNNISTNAALESANKVFSYIFAVEMVFKIYALGIKKYSHDGFNIFDGVLVVVSLFDIVLQSIVGKSTGASVITVFRTLRLLRVFKLATKS